MSIIKNYTKFTYGLRIVYAVSDEQCTPYRKITSKKQWLSPRYGKKKVIK